MANAAPNTPSHTGKQFYYGLGRRKCAIAQVRLFPGEGNVIVNGLSSREYFGRETLDIQALTSLRAVETGASFNAVAKVYGGGKTGQSGAIKLGIARALLAMDESHRAALRAGGLLTRDPRVKERKKPGLRRARRAPQYTKR